ncbi:CPNE9 [Symbiodinium pilosum]|uniref:CPNE9 protein n=1 Tax=Symbiodinium pilosum TaxID=2952 RepID=A0A812QKJ7_SYMPI|nr:CPNE9 [Symbiodinium pilosum]
MVAIDFTRSNLGQTNPKSMHSVVHMEEETAYATAIRSLGEVMSVYDNDKCYPIYGFGAKIPPSHSVVSNCFALTGDFFQPEVEGVEGMLKAYHRALRICHLHGPSYLAAAQLHFQTGTGFQLPSLPDRYNMVFIIS